MIHGGGAILVLPLEKGNIGQHYTALAVDICRPLGYLELELDGLMG